MKREDKDQFVSNIVSVLLNNTFLILVSFSHMRADDSLSLRNSLKSIGSGLLVVKNTLARLALEKANKFSNLSDKFSGPVAIIYSDSMVETSKLIVDFAKVSKDKISIICAAHLDQLMLEGDVKKLASLPSLDELRIKIMRLISYNLPMRFALSVNSSAMRLMRVLDFYGSKK